SGLVRLPIRLAMRQVTTRVLPVPAPANTNSGPDRVSTASRCAGLRDIREGSRNGEREAGIEKQKRGRENQSIRHKSSVRVYRRGPVIVHRPEFTAIPHQRAPNSALDAPFPRALYSC